MVRTHTALADERERAGSSARSGERVSLAYFEDERADQVCWKYGTWTQAPPVMKAGFSQLW